MQTGTLARLCVRKKFGNVRVRTVTLSQFTGGSPAQGLQRNLAAFSQEKKSGCVQPEKWQARPSTATGWTPTPEF
jgi:hypothetical protein